MSFARVRALAVVVALAVAAIVFVVVAVVRDSQGGAQAVEGCPAGYVRADIRFPVPKDVKVRIYNGTQIFKLGEQVAGDFRNRRFQVDERVTTATRSYNGVAMLQYGPLAVGSAHLIKAYFLGAEPKYDPKRKGTVVDVTIGAAYQKLGTTTEVNQAISILGEPELPARACPTHADS
ncbi:hypothetical protein GCM10010124_34530 [Pilimelia terevasa]|uniref:LytR/CpsA/Psr regulator C-terminal domain-containing protein n=1 Tax=Pilimelia terevasa TaxID=53372 RepID=A0A8J3FJB9_9ACTN|nr:LytR C-terminal domain-containing protein [Pilimelia terevasa]GGK38803.1 hypothetical protein GCM10010124_34530 [Pilimelia terevasa]